MTVWPVRWDPRVSSAIQGLEEKRRNWRCGPQGDQGDQGPKDFEVSKEIQGMVLRGLKVYKAL